MLVSTDYIEGIWDIDEIPLGKRRALIKFYNGLLSRDELMQAPKGKNKLFCDGDTVLSCCIYSLYENGNWILSLTILHLCLLMQMKVHG